ncbi:PREDICTED: FAD synthase-like [Amphimedon queenslandica]|uniref:FAD synthase n=1 Tax=Amphimedon queenslandica TaxID=400682 RepID=A0A1X7VMJ2_AMPQE|nr:PREDICTED: FAD synthase-like [Amphimedon queenslandica]|eukprot:XP_003383452.1 PREDICTED: FAD synthase-like [Amphimedon queenslandica]
MDSRVQTAGIIVIGEEILKGHVHDINSHYLAKELWSLGVKVKKISVVGDDVDDISQEVKIFSHLYDYVLTSGGIGPTHDDVTMAGIAKAFDEVLTTNPDMLKVLTKDGVRDEENIWLRMAIVPSSAVFCPQTLTLCPLVRIHNVYPFAGMPSALRSTFQYHKQLFASKEKSAGFFLKEVFFLVEEDNLAVPLNVLQNEFKDSVQVGSYPIDDMNSSVRVKVSLEGSDISIIEKCYCSLLLKMGPQLIQSVQNSWKNKDEVKLRESLKWLETELVFHRLHLAPMSLLIRINETIETLKVALDKFGLDGLCIAFTGGKDCTVLLPLYQAVIKSKGLSYEQLKTLYVSPKNSFTEVEEFIGQTIKKYKLDLIRIEGTIQEALGSLKVTHPSINAIIMGTRSTDPYSDNLKTFSSTDANWPQYTRIHCILDWTYSQVWVFLRLFEIPYCQLYDKGYTSLGNSTDTKPNPALSMEAIQTDAVCNGISDYQPAYCLFDETLERAGRSKN